jgi:hypothetical protein
VAGVKKSEPEQTKRKEVDMASPLVWLYLFAWILIPVLLISGLIRIRRFGLRCFEEYKRTRLEVGKIAEEISLIRKQLDRTSHPSS